MQRHHLAGGAHAAGAEPKAEPPRASNFRKIFLKDYSRFFFIISIAMKIYKKKNFE
jgi:hypothetical protein